MRKQKGFTLVELLTTTALIAVISSLAMAQLDEYSSRALDSQALSAMRDILISREVYLIDNLILGTTYPVCEDTAACFTALSSYGMTTPASTVYVESFANGNVYAAAADKGNNCSYGTGTRYEWGLNGGLESNRNFYASDCN